MQSECTEVSKQDGVPEFLKIMFPDKFTKSSANSLY